jgi:hypothetical protein
MEPRTKPANTVWPFPFTPQDWEQTPPAVQAYLCTVRDELAQLHDRVESLEHTFRTPLEPLDSILVIF